MRRSQYKAAAFWFRAAPACTPSEEDGGFGLPECRGYIPMLQLCVCHDRLGNLETAEMYNEQAAAFKPESEAVRLNRAYFAARRAQPEAARP